MCRWLSLRAYSAGLLLAVVGGGWWVTGECWRAGPPCGWPEPQCSVFSSPCGPALSAGCLNPSPSTLHPPRPKRRRTSWKNPLKSRSEIGPASQWCRRLSRPSPRAGEKVPGGRLRGRWVSPGVRVMSSDVPTGLLPTHHAPPATHVPSGPRRTRCRAAHHSDKRKQSAKHQ